MTKKKICQNRTGFAVLFFRAFAYTFTAAAAVYPRLCGEGKPTEISEEIAAFFGLPEEESGKADADALAAAYIEKYNALYTVD